MLNKLSIFEFGRLAKLEKVIEAGRRTFTEVGDSLLEIKESNLWREKYESFDDYCEKKWGWGRKRANQLINASVVVKGLTKETATIVANEGQVRELSKVPSDKRSEVLEKAKKTGKPVTAKVINEARKNTSNPESARPVEARVAGDASPDKTNVPVVAKDETGYPLPPAVIGLWERRQEVDLQLSALKTTKRVIAEALEKEDRLFSGVIRNTFLSEIANVISHLEGAVPFAVCPYCQGKLIDKCTFCAGRGIVSESRLKTVPDDIMKVRAIGIKK